MLEILEAGLIDLKVTGLIFQLQFPGRGEEIPFL